MQKPNDFLKKREKTRRDKITRRLKRYKKATPGTKVWSLLCRGLFSFLPLAGDDRLAGEDQIVYITHAVGVLVFHSMHSLLSF